MPLEEFYPEKNLRDRARLAASLETPDPDLNNPTTFGEPLEVNLPPESSIANGLQELSDGTLLVGDPGEEQPAPETGFYDNLALTIESADLQLIADELDRLVESDEKSMQPWIERATDALVLLGADKKTATGWIKKGANFDGASTVVHPMLAEAVVQFNARAMKELMPPGGPVKTYVKGEESEDVREQAERVEEHMNYQICYEDEGYEDDMDRLLFYLPFTGSAFKKTYFDPIKKQLCSRFIIGTDIICPYMASSLEDSPRITHKFMEQPNNVLKKIRAGFYRDAGLTGATILSQDQLKDATKTAEGRTANTEQEDMEYEMRETSVYLDLPGFKDTYIDETTGQKQESGIKLPYLVTFEKNEKKILAIYRNWQPDDEQKRRELWITHYKFLPGLGMYGYGYLHLIGGVTETATGTLRALMDSAAFANLQGGFVLKDAKIKKGDITLKPGVWKYLEATFEDIKKAFYTPPFKEPSPAMFDLLKLLEDGAQRFMSTVDVAVGDAKNTGPVGTTVALIEQATKIMSGVHTRLHRAQGREFRLRAKLNQRYLPEEGLQYIVRGGSKNIKPDDYQEEKIEIIPVSDPNISSQTQRIALSQALIERAAQVPDLYDRYRVEKRFLEAIGGVDDDGILLQPQDAPYTTPLNELALLLAGKPIKVFYEQNHDAHLAVHQVTEQYLMTLPPEIATRLVPMMEEHMAKHRAYQAYQQAAAVMGIKAEPIDLYASGTDEASLQPQVENALAVTEAQRISAVSAMLQQAQMAQQAAQANAAAPPGAAEEQSKQADEQRKQQAHDNEQHRKNTEFMNKQKAKADELNAGGAA